MDADLLRAAAHVMRDAALESAGQLQIGVAVSGGGDSMALLHLLYRAAAEAGFRVHAVTVDHGLRPEAAKEAAQVAAFCARLGLPHETLRWQRPKTTGNLMDQARRGRIGLIARWAREHGICHVALGHTADDQAESFLMNLSRAAGLEGLSGMRPDWQEAGVHWVRPLLAFGRETLRDYLRHNGVAWVDDPTNEDDHYARVRARRVIRAMAPLGISVPGIVESIDHLATANDALVQLTARAAEEIVEHAGALSVPKKLFWSEPDEIRRRLLNGIIRWMSGSEYKPRAAQVAHLAEALREGRAAILGGVRFVPRDEAFCAYREARAVMPGGSLGQVWDHRWIVTGPEKAEVRALGTEGLSQIPDWRSAGIDRNIALVTPGVWSDDRLISAPVLGFGEGYSATIALSLRIFLLSH